MRLLCLSIALFSAALQAQTILPEVANGPTSTISAAADPWWKHAVVYEIYPRSFADSNSDGVGDLNGITKHLDYLQHLGIDAIWIAPMYPSPQVDFGYDIADYEAVDPMYGTLADFNRLQAEAKKRRIRVVLDMVLNHTSDKDKWFLESSSSRNNPKADWYVWNSGVAADSPNVTAYQKKFEHDGMVPPNNWVSSFGGSAWEWAPARKQFYYHFFYKQQPDLNWTNPAVEAAMFDIMKFWLDRGVAGFRLDAIPTLFEDPQLRNEKEMGGVNAQGDPNVNHQYTYNQPQVHGVLRRLRAMVDAYPGNRVLIGETYVFRTADLDPWYGGAARDELHLPMDTLVGFGLTLMGKPATLNASSFRRYINEAETQLHGQPLFVFDNHDNARSIDRFGDSLHNTKIAKLIATVLFTTPATALTYEGAEIGMVTTTPTRKEDVRDPIGLTGWPKEKGRDGERTPMQWSPGPEAGFSSNPHTWLPVATNYKTVNVQTEETEPDSLLSWYRDLIALRRSNPALHSGSIVMLDKENPDVLSYLRKDGNHGEPVLVLINMSNQERTVDVDLACAGVTATSLQVLAETDSSLRPTSFHSLSLPAFSALVASVK
jgi:alpha-glucosidase